MIIKSTLSIACGLDDKKPCSFQTKWDELKILAENQDALTNTTNVKPHDNVFWNIIWDQLGKTSEKWIKFGYIYSISTSKQTQYRNKTIEQYPWLNCM